jgi:hypothetical protein
MLIRGRIVGKPRQNVGGKSESWLKGGFERSPPVPCRRDFQASIERDTDPTRVCTDNLNTGRVVMKSAQDGA